MQETEQIMQNEKNFTRMKNLMMESMAVKTGEELRQPKEHSDGSEMKSKEQKRAMERLHDEIGYSGPFIPRKSMAAILIDSPLMSSKYPLKVPFRLDDSNISYESVEPKQKFRTTSFHHQNDQWLSKDLLSPLQEPRKLAEIHGSSMLDRSPKSASKKSKFSTSTPKNQKISSFLKP